MSILRRVRGMFERLAARLTYLPIRRRQPALVRLPKTLGALLAAVAIAPAALADSTAELIAHRNGDGPTYYALSLTPPAAEQSGPSDVVIVFDTSASQVGVYRDTALAALEACVAKLQPTDRVQILAADLEARPITEKFLAIGSPELKAATAELRKQLPLGSTDMEAALRTAAGRFDKDSKSNRAVLYIGDGMSTANFLASDSFRELVHELRDARVPVSSYAIGPRRDAELLAAVANQTGGNLYVDEAMSVANDAEGVTVERAQQENLRRGQAIGESLAAWTKARVLWPASVTLPQPLTESYPREMPPLRSDRETVLVGSTTETLKAPLEIKIEAASGADMADLAWTATPTNDAGSYAYLSQVVESARADGGITLTTLGLAGLAETGRMLNASLDGMSDLAQRAVATGDHATAEQMSQAVLRRDPGNVQARTVQRVIRRPQETPATADATAAPAATDDLNLIRTAQAPMPPQDLSAPGATFPAEGAIVDQFDTNGAFLDEVEQQKRVFAQMLRREVENTVVDARRIMSNDPEAASQELKLALQNVERAPELNPDVRAQLIDRLQIALREVQRAAFIKDELDAAREEELAVARERQVLNERLLRNIERKKQLIDRFGALIDERRFDEAMEVAAVVEEIDPEGVTPRVASLWSEMKRNDYLFQLARAARWQKYWETLYQVELSSIAFPDDPPIVYPDAPVWEELTIRRKKFASVDLSAGGGAEERINEALDSPLRATGLDFTEQPLEDVVNFLQEQYEIPIQLDVLALEDAGLTADEPVNINLQNITLRSALRIMLKQLQLTYIIQDEVMFITTPERAEEDLVAKVYPVADLVLPIEVPQMGGGGMMGGGGGMGGGGMGGGGMGGGMGGGGGGFGGGGMGGGGMGGGGGGMFSVPDDADAKPSTDAKAAAPKATVAKVEIDETVSPATFWSDYFSFERDPATVRQAARDLMAEKKTDQLAAMIQAALVAGQPQPWMYESLGIALELNGASKSEVERVLMSAADFATTPDELMYLADYLSRNGLDRRAVQLCQQVIKIQPLRHEAYAVGLRSAERANDLAAIQWATLGILKQAWTAKEAPIQAAATEASHTVMAELEKQGRTEELNKYRQQLKAAEVRDCVVKVSWTGNADVDIEVEEPTGSICSATTPRTASGGVSLGDVFAGESENSPVLSETYVCPQGFPGKYRVRIHRVLGEVAAGKVTVDVYRHQGSDREQHERRQLDLSDKDAMVVFELDSGRRNEPIESVQLAGAVERQKQMSRSVLAQQIDSLSDQRLLGGISEAERRRRMAGFLGVGRGAVGFQPIITVLPEGTQLGISGVISADRRYVRISVSPVFSTIGDVQTFTFAGSAQETDDGGGGNGGGGF